MRPRGAPSSRLTTLDSLQFVPFSFQLGGAILAEGASTAVLTGVRVTSNEATLFGGGVSLNDGSSCVVTDSYVEGNAAGEGGGGLHFAGATGMLDGVTLSGNSVTAGRCVCVCVCPDAAASW